MSALFGAMLLCLVLGLGAKVRASGLRYYPSPLTDGLGAVVDLKGIWFDENNYRHIVPFNKFDRDEMALRREFDLPEYNALQDTLYLYLEAVAWSSEIFLNDKLLAVTEDPFKEHLLPIQKSWLKPTGNVLRVRMTTHGLSFPWYPEPFIGIFRQALILQADRQTERVSFPKQVTTARRAAMIASWQPGPQYLDDTTIILKLTSGLFAYPYQDPLAFPFRPSNHAQAIIAAQGWQMLSNPGAADSLAVYNSYPYASATDHKLLRFWRDSQMRPTSNYGHFQTQTAIVSPKLTPPDRTSLVIFLLLPVICMLLLKVAAPKAYGSLGEYITKTKIYLELIADNKFLKGEQRWLMNILRIIVTSVTVSLLLYYVELSESWRMVNIFSTKGLIYRYLAPEDVPLWEIFLVVFGLVAGLNLAKYFLINSIGTVFRLFNLNSSIQNLDVFAAFPLNLAPYIPASFIFFLEPGAGSIVLTIWGFLFVLYGVRRVALLYAGLSRLYAISGSLKILYICTLEILPWLILV
ncbi:MAG: DUF4271 domain-containing protein [Bacteroidia bacterium]